MLPSHESTPARLGAVAVTLLFKFLCLQMQRKVAMSCTSCPQSGSVTALTWAKRHWSWSSSRWSVAATSSAWAKTITQCFKWNAAARGRRFYCRLCFVTCCYVRYCFKVRAGVNHVIWVPFAHRDFFKSEFIWIHLWCISDAIKSNPALVFTLMVSL